MRPHEHRTLASARATGLRPVWTRQTISLFGDGILTVALAWQVLQLSSSPVALAGVLLARSVPRVVLLVVGGAISDRMSRRLVLLTSDLVQGVAVGVVTVLGATGHLQLCELSILGAVTGAGSAFFLPASAAVIPQQVSPDLLMAGNSLSSSSRLLAEQLLGPALGGVLVAAAGTTWVFGTDAASFAVSVSTLLLIRARPEITAPSSGVLGAVREGFSCARSKPWIWITLISVGTVGNFLAYEPLPVLLPLLVREPLGGGSSGTRSRLRRAGIWRSCLGWHLWHLPSAAAQDHRYVRRVGNVLSRSRRSLFRSQRCRGHGP